jgi:hypothetical protein
LFACRYTYRCDYDRCESDDRDSIFYFINILSHSNSSSAVTTTSYSTTTGSPSPAASKVATEMITSAAAEPKPAQNHTGVIAGAAVGGFVCLAAIAGLVFFFRRRAK